MGLTSSAALSSTSAAARASRFCSGHLSTALSFGVRCVGTNGGSEVARGLSLFGGASSEVRRCNCSVVDESRSSLAGLAARCMSFYEKSIYLSIYLL